MKSNKKTFLVFNATDGFYASPDAMTKEEAESFINQFPERFRFQGYYRTGRWEKIRPEDVELEIIPLGVALRQYSSVTNRDSEVKNVRRKKSKDKGLQR